ncbi:hypothetical protein DLA64_10740 [Salmonella enterica]|nr:hypothetical protein [Salmonella enterica]
MTASYYSIPTNLGASKIANAIATNIPLNLTEMAVGDGGGAYVVPDPEQTALVNECYRTAINSITINADDSQQLIVEMVIPEDVGGFTEREIGIFDEDGDLIIVANCAAIEKAPPDSGSPSSQVIRLPIEISSAAAINIVIDPSAILVTQEYADNTFLKKESNLSDLADVKEARDNLELGDAATKDVGTTTGTVAAGDDSRITGALQSSKNLSDLVDADEARTNLGLGTAATANVTTSNTDKTTNSLLKVGDFGVCESIAIGGDVETISPADLMKILNGMGSGFYRINYTVEGMETADSSGFFSRGVDTSTLSITNYLSGQTYALSCNDASLAAGNVNVVSFIDSANGGSAPFINSGVFNCDGNPGAGGFAEQYTNMIAPFFNQFYGNAESEYFPLWKQTDIFNKVSWSGGQLVQGSGFVIQCIKEDGSGGGLFTFGLDGSFYAPGNITANNGLTVNNNEIVSKSGNGLRLAQTNYGAFFRNDDVSFYLMLTNAGDPLGTWNDLRPFSVSLDDGDVTFGSDVNVAGELTENAQRVYSPNNPPSTASKASNGWFKDNYTGIIFQWGYVGATGGADGRTITFPIAFTSSCIHVSGATAMSGASDYAVAVTSITNSNCFLSSWDGRACYWFAIGY